MGLLMKRTLAALALLALGVACRDPALASGRASDPNIALCAAAHSLPSVLLEMHHQTINEDEAMDRLAHIRHMIENNATGPYARHLHDVAAAVNVFEIVTKSRGDTSDAYRDLRALRESLPRCSPRPGIVPHSQRSTATSD